jgi:transposase-like protein
MESCIYCKGSGIVKNGRTASGIQEFYCKKCKSYFTSNSNPDYHRSRFDAETMRLTTLWYFRFNLSLRNLAEIMLSRGIDVSHQTIARWVKTIGPELGKQALYHWNPRRAVSWYVDETYIKVKGQWKYLYRAVDRDGETLDVMLSAHRSKKAAKRFFKKTLKSMGIKPERIYTDKNNAYPGANGDILNAKHGIMHIAITPVERSHVPVKRRYHAMSGFMNFHNANRFVQNFEYIRGYIGGTNISNRQMRFETWDKVQSLVNKKAS